MNILSFLQKSLSGERSVSKHCVCPESWQERLFSLHIVKCRVARVFIVCQKCVALHTLWNRDCDIFYACVTWRKFRLHNDNELMECFRWLLDAVSPVRTSKVFSWSPTACELWRRHTLGALRRLKNTNSGLLCQMPWRHSWLPAQWEAKPLLVPVDYQFSAPIMLWSLIRMVLIRSLSYKSCNFWYLFVSMSQGFALLVICCESSTTEANWMSFKKTKLYWSFDLVVVCMHDTAKN